MTPRCNHLSVLLLVLLATLLPGAAALPSLQSILPQQLRKKEYTPLLFFKVPAGLMPECDALEAAVCEVEKELGVRVERMDVLRNPANEAVLALLTQQRTPPLLYHRESCQMVYLTPAKGADPKKKVYVNKDRVRAWAKGRHLTRHSAAMEDSVAASKVAAPTLLQSEEESGMDQTELLEEMALTPEQLKGKRLIQERTKAKAAKKKETSAPKGGGKWVESPM